MAPPDYIGLKCYTDGSWKNSDKYSGLGWYCFSERRHRDHDGSPEPEKEPFPSTLGD